jgi:two-component system, chemotaxis family, protein-glutamate methylesterase/glutaminase
MPPVRVMLVDDSVVVRKLVCEALACSPELQVVATACSGAIALAKIPQVNPDVVTLDIEMPGMDGLQTLTRIRELYPKLPVIMFSTLTERGAAITLEALSRGASDYLAKPSNSTSLASAMDQVGRELISKILTLGRRWPRLPSVVASTRKKASVHTIELVAIGVSTGGPNALAEVITRLPADFPVPITIVQHMPALFTRLLAERLASQSQLTVREAKPGSMLHPGHVWIAPGDYHMRVLRTGSGMMLALSQDPPENSCRPAVDVLFRSVAETCGPNALGIIMTGMGSDGVIGASLMHELGGEILVQDEPSSVVWGMPGAVVSAGVADGIFPLSKISTEILRRVNAARVTAILES